MRKEQEDFCPDALFCWCPFSSSFKTPQGSLTRCGLSAVVGLGIPLCSACFHGRNSQVSTLFLISLGQGTESKYSHAGDKGVEHYGVPLQFIFSLSLSLFCFSLGNCWESSLPARNPGQHGGSQASPLVGQTRC